MNTQLCAWENCQSEGIHKAPKSRDTTEYLWFCLHHVRTYNASWDYFSGWSAEAIQQFQIDALTGHRPHTPYTASKAHYWQYEPFIRQHHQTPTTLSAKETATALAMQRLPVAEQQALELLQLSFPFTKEQTRAAFKTLAKKYHPDVNPTANAHQTFQKITHAYHLLMESVYLTAT